MSLTNIIKSSAKLKKIVLWVLMPKNQARPRTLIKKIIHPFILKKGKNSRIQPNTRMDILPNFKFYLGDNSTIEDFCTINNGVGKIYIGNDTRIGIGSVLIGPVHIGNNIRLAQNVVISALNHNYEDVSLPISNQGVVTKEVYIGDETWIGANTVILPGVFIGKHCVVAAGSVVTKSVPSYTVVAGNPAKIIKKYQANTNKWIKKLSA
ncbi:acyltransferase [Plebeiibacterium sediminum]|uniref:Acyltransferase n=1 Tax=Plebeiibacterium sediminum TaxID=2992112 RepID=A0AAE3M5B7_9BACT|nr:acyltransferase [Plebeiobacterium sediminum]MCW3787477.1 acyltransferase [Plebeiobacterium sediminum]